MKTVILAGGFGTRLSEYTNLIPKPMVEIGQKPILIHIMNWYLQYNFNEFLIATGYKSEIINDYFESLIRSKNQDYDFNTGKIAQLSQVKKSLKVKTIYSGLNSMTGGRLLSIRKFINEENFMVTYGDGLANIDVSKLIEFHKSHKKIATITAVRPIARFGVLNLEGNKVNSFKEKKQIDQGWINGGFFVFNKKIFDYIRDSRTILEKEPLEQLASENELFAYKHEGFWQCMDNKRDKDYLQELLDSGKAPWIPQKKEDKFL